MGNNRDTTTAVTVLTHRKKAGNMANVKGWRQKESCEAKELLSQMRRPGNVSLRRKLLHGVTGSE